MIRVALLAVLLAACETPPLTIKFRLSDSDSQQCTGDTGTPAMSCSDISMDCDAVLSVRIVPPATPEIPYVSVCERISTSQTSQRKLCQIAGVDLPQPKDPIPEQTLEVQMAVFAYDALDRDGNGKPICPRVEYGVDGLPIESVDCTDLETGACRRRPAVGGRAFYHPGDTETLVELGCTELELLRGEMCAGINRTEVIATVNEFEYPSSVDLATAGRLFVSIGEPTPGTTDNYVLDSGKTHTLSRLQTASLPTWRDEFDDLGLTSSFCIAVLEDAPFALTCRKLDTANPAKVDATGIRLKPETLSTILRALYGPAAPFPPEGLVVGIVLGQNFQPVPSVTVKTACALLPQPTCFIKYLSADKLSFTGATATSSNGIWVSDAPYMSTFFQQEGVTEVFGGRVENKITIVVLQEPTVGGGGI